MIDYVKRLFKKPTEIYTARNMKNSHYFLFVLLMAISMTLLSLFSVKPEFDKLSNDYNEVHSFIPDFELVDGKLNSDEESYIYQTDNIVFYFDSENKMDTDLIDKNIKIQTAPISIGLMNDEIYLNILEFDQSYSYSDLNLTTNDLKTSLNLENSYKPLIIALTLVILLFFNLFLYLMQLLSITIFANLISVLQRSGLKLVQNAKIALMASMIPFLIISITNALQIQISYQYEVISIVSLLLFYMSINEFKSRLKEKNNSKKK